MTLSSCVRDKQIHKGKHYDIVVTDNAEIELGMDFRWSKVWMEGRLVSGG